MGVYEPCDRCGMNTHMLELWLVEIDGEPRQVCKICRTFIEIMAELEAIQNKDKEANPT